MNFNLDFLSVDDLRKKAKSRIRKFAFEYLDGGCNEDISLSRNTAVIRKIQLQPRYLSNYDKNSIKIKVMGIQFNTPFGIAPVRLQGLM